MKTSKRDDFYDMLRLHAALYPAMEPADAVKLAYQSVFGGGHLIADAAEGLRRLSEERALVRADAAGRLKRGAADESPDPTAFTPIGGGFARLELAAAALSPLPDELLFRMFYLSAQRPAGDEKVFSLALDTLRAAAAEGIFAFPVSALDAYLAACRAAGCPPVSHSTAYRRAYRPAYRVVDTMCAELLPLILRLSALIKRDRPFAVAIEGQAAAGKTTAAANLSELFLAPVVHMDDFYLPPDIRTQQRLVEPGGNVHCERFIAEVLPHLGSGAAFSCRVFDCGRAAYAGTRDIPASRLVLVEGAYSLHPAFGNPYAASAFFAVSAAEQERRIRARNGGAAWERFRNIWIPMENRYHDAFNIRARCDDVIEMGGIR